MGLDLVVGNRQKDRLLDLVIRIFQGEGPLTLKGDVMKDPRWEDLSLDKPTFHTRAFIKIQEGCDHFCSYCLIPFLRGKPVSRPLDSILREVRSVSEGGCKEAVLTGIHLGLYGKDLGETLASVIKSVGEVPGIKRIRLGSLEPFSLKDDLLLTMRDTVQFCPHLHLPLQSGDDSILRAMKRGHSSKDYLDLLDRIRKILGDGVHISTDVLVGFPGEDRRAFENTLEVLKKGAIGRVHVFPFSPRKGTAAFSFQDRPSRQTAEERCLEVMDLGRSLMENYSKKWLGREVSVLVEGSKDRNIWGYTSHFLKVKAKGSSAVSSICGVFIDTFEGRELRGKVI